MAEVLVLSEADVDGLLDLEELLAALGDALTAVSTGRASVPPRVAAWAAAGGLGAMPVHLDGVALGAKLVSIFPGNHRRGRPSHQALIALFDPADGTPVAVMGGTRITAARTGATAAVAAGALARPDAGADVVCCCTDTREPILEAGWLAPGTHVSSVGGTFGPELDPAIVRAGRVLVEWRGAAANPPPAGAHELQGLDPGTLTEVGEILAGTRPGRASPEELTVYKSTGHAVEDAAAAGLVYRRALEAGAGVGVAI
jgi:alanine dehydrogenase